MKGEKLVCPLFGTEVAGSFEDGFFRVTVRDLVAIARITRTASSTDLGRARVDLAQLSATVLVRDCGEAVFFDDGALVGYVVDNDLLVDPSA